MHPSTAAIRPRPPQATFSRTAWVVIGLLGTTVAALGSALVMRSPAPAPADLAPQVSYANDLAPTAAGNKPLPVASDGNAAPGEAPTASPVPAPAHATAKAPSRHAAPATVQPHADSDVAPAPGTRGEIHGTQPAVVSVCNSCGVVEAVEPVQREGKASGVGAVAGGVVGGALGNRMGAGSGKTAMTVLGVVGGGLAGHAIEKKVKTETVYRVKVRMEDGSVRSFTQAKTMAVGTQVTVQGETLKVAPASTQTAQVARNSA
ncbi:glycine zipper 2TM domain-containing protein [Ideonella sp. DXS29W]|uniref:Glycine zipper 2TM domain-containing protein n=1 Tax=Ideonella lacteola TaxID=2984193 RepID=A0ABU9BSL3_9BURK